MNEMVFNSMTDFFNHIHSRGGATVASHGSLGNFYASMSVYTNPNTCSCKKGKNAYNSLVTMVKNLPTSLGNNTSNAKSLFDNQTVVVNENGAEIVRF